MKLSKIAAVNSSRWGALCASKGVSMYYDEQVIDGVLCHRSTPDGEWVPFTLKAFTTSLIAMRGCYEREKERAEKAEWLDSGQIPEPTERE
jgi:hypothetical protein